MPISGKQHVLGKPAVGGRLGCWVAVMSHCSDTEMGDWHKTQGDMKEMFFFVCFCFVCRYLCCAFGDLSPRFHGLPACMYVGLLSCIQQFIAVLTLLRILVYIDLVVCIH